MKLFKHLYYGKEARKILIGVILFLLIVSSLLFRKIVFNKNATNLNLIIISVDTLRPDHMGVYGYKKNTTPNIDKFAKKSTVFTNVSTVVPMTYPSFTALMTGQDMLKTRVIANQGYDISENTKTLATRLKEKGYITSAFVSGAVNSLSQGFDTFDSQIFKYYYSLDGVDRYGQESRDDYEKFLKKASDWIVQNKNKRFFTWIHLIDPHTPYFPSDEFSCKFNTKYCSQIQGKTVQELDFSRAQYQQCQNNTVPKDRIELMNTLYDGSIATADVLVGKILKETEKSGINKNTIIVFYGDHGEGFDHNYYFNHQEVLYNSATHIPLIIYNPQSEKGAVSNTLLQNMDIMPTLLELLGISHENLFSGKSFVPALTNNLITEMFSAKTRKYSISSDSSWKKFSISDGRYKYIFSLPGSCIYPGQPEELYDQQKDWNELNNIINEKMDVAKRLKSELLKYLAQYNMPQTTKPIAPLIDDDNEKPKNDLKSLQY